MKKTVKNLITWSPSHLITSPKFAFTLAEVLITLAIIGVVAAMTIPTLTANYKKKLVETRLLNGYSALSQAVQLSTVDYGPTNTWDSFGPSWTSTATYDDIKAWYDKYLAKYLRSQKVEKAQDSEDLVVYLLDGSALQFRYYGSDVYFYPEAKFVGVRENGVNSFKFWIGVGEHLSQDLRAKYYPKNGIDTYSYAWDGTYEGAKYSTLDPAYGCYQDYHALCAKLIQLNGWKIPEDYPFNF